MRKKMVNKVLINEFKVETIKLSNTFYNFYLWSILQNSCFKW